MSRQFLCLCVCVRAPIPPFAASGLDTSANGHQFRGYPSLLLFRSPRPGIEKLDLQNLSILPCTLTTCQENSTVRTAQGVGGVVRYGQPNRGKECGPCGQTSLYHLSSYHHYPSPLSATSTPLTCLLLSFSSCMSTLREHWKLEPSRTGCRIDDFSIPPTVDYSGPVPS